MSRTLIALLCSGVLFVALPALAQVNFGGTGALTISANPSYPTPNSTVQLTAESPLLDLADSDIEWTVNGVSAGSGESINVKLGGLGQETDIGVSVSGPSGGDSASLSLVPTSIDLLWESDSYVPPFYLGRAMPGSDSTITVMAMPHFVRSDGSSVASSDIKFTWKLNGATLKAQSGIGETSVVVPAATLYDSDTVVVYAQASDGTLAGEASVSIRTGDPQLLLYEDSPLFGVMYDRALSGTSAASESESSIAAVPYFAAILSPNDPSLSYDWNVNGSPVVADPKDPSELTLSSQSQGTAQVQLSVTKLSDPFFSASGSWNINFSSAGSTGGNVFGASSQ